jgi:hypothetical protein
MRIVKIGSRQFAVGLWWQMFSAPGTTMRKGLVEARATAQSIESSDFSMVALRRSQFGLGQWQGKLPRVMSLAAAVAGSVPGTWIGHFLLEEGSWWVCAVSGGAIVAEGDYVSSSSKEANRHLTDLRALLNWDVEVSFETVAESHAHLLPLISSGAKVVPLHGGQGLPPLALPMLLASAAVAAAIWLYFDKQEEIARQISLESARSRIFNTKALSSDPDRQFPTPWKRVHSAWFTAEASLKFIQAQPTFVRGWELTETEWTSAGVKSTYQYQPGASFSSLPDGASIESTNPTQCRTRVPLAMPNPTEELELASIEHASKCFFELTRRLGAKGHLKFDAPMTKKVSDVQLTATWAAGKWRLSDLSPSVLGADLPALLRQVPGMTVTRVLYKSTLTLEGSVYARVRKDS